MHFYLNKPPRCVAYVRTFMVFLNGLLQQHRSGFYNREVGTNVIHSCNMMTEPKMWYGHTPNSFVCPESCYSTSHSQCCIHLLTVSSINTCTTFRSNYLYKLHIIIIHPSLSMVVLNSRDWPEKMASKILVCQKIHLRVSFVQKIR